MKKIMISNKTLSRIVYIIVLLFFVVPVIFTFAKFIAFSLAEPSEHNELMKSEYLLMTIQSLLGIFAINIPYLLTKKYKIRVPITFIILYDIFLFCAIYLGEIRKFYIKVNMWDNVLHAFSSLMLGLFGFMLVYVLNKSLSAEGITSKLSPIFIAFFAFSFSVAMGCIWEIYEFTFDYFFDLNMQKYRLDDGTPLIGRKAVFDTMKDIIIDVLGALTATIIGYLSILRKKGFVNEYLSSNENSETTGKND